MPTQITYLGHSAFEIDTGEYVILIDPFLTGNPRAAKAAADVHPTAIIVTHGHGDHVGDTIAIAKRTGCLVVANFEIVTWLQQQGVENCHSQHIGGSHRHEFGTIKLTIAHHGSMLPDGSNGGNPCGVLLKLADGTVYHAGDTGLFYDMKLIGEENVDLAILPIGDNYTMGPDDAVRATRLIGPRQVVPAHYDTWPLLTQNTSAWAEKVRTETNAEPVVLAPGKSLTLG